MTMMQISPDVRIVVDRYQATVQHRSTIKDKKTGEESDMWRGVSHWPTVPAAIEDCVHHDLSKVEQIDAAAVLEIWERYVALVELFFADAGDKMQVVEDLEADA